MKENQRITLTRRLLRDALLALLREMPLEKISVSALCRAAGINRTTFYHHYTTPHDVLLAMECEITDELNREIAAHGESPREALIGICRYLRRRADTIGVLFRNNTDEQLSNIIQHLNLLLLEPRAKTGHALPQDPDTLVLTATFLGTGMYYLIRRWLTEEIDKTPEEIAALILGILGDR